MREAESITVAGHTFRITQLPARRAMELFGKVLRIAGPAMLEFLAQASSGKIDPDKEFDASAARLLGPVIVELTSRIKDGELTEITNMVLEGAVCDNKPLSVDAVDMLFRGQVVALLSLIVHACRVHIGDFFGAGLAASPAAGPAGN